MRTIVAAALLSLFATLGHAQEPVNDPETVCKGLSEAESALREGKVLDDKSLLDLTCKLTMKIVNDSINGSTLVGPECRRAMEMLFIVANDRRLDMEAAKHACEEQWKAAFDRDNPKP